MTIKTELQKAMTVQERVMEALLSYGEKEVYFTKESLMNKLPGLDWPSIYQAIHRMSTTNSPEGALRILKEKNPETNRERVIGVEILKAAPVGRVRERVIERIQVGVEAKARGRLVEQVPTLMKYLEQTLVIEDLKKRAREAGLDDRIINFDIDPLAEEAGYLLREYIRVSQENRKLTIENEAKTRDIKYLTEQVNQGEKVRVNQNEQVQVGG